MKDGVRLGLRDLLSKVINRATIVLSEVPVVLLQFWILSESVPLSALQSRLDIACALILFQL